MLVAALLAGCGGSSSSGTNASPATVVPSSAPFYVDAVVSPTGSLKSDALSAGRGLTSRSQPYMSLLKLLQGPTGKTPSDGEVKSWLGENAGLFIGSISTSGAKEAAGAASGLLREALSKALGEGFAGAEAALTGSRGVASLLGRSGVQGALVLDTTNPDAARSFLEGQAHGAGAHGVSYGGTTFEVAPDGIAEGVVGRFAVIGSEAGLRSVIETHAGSASLAHAAGYQQLVSGAEGGRLANAYANLEGLSGALGSSAGGEGSPLTLLDGLLGDAGRVYASLIPSSSSVALDVDTLASSRTRASSAGGGTGTTGAQVLRGLPGNAWLALGFGDLGKTLGGGAGALRAMGSLFSGLSLGSFSAGSIFAPLSSLPDAQRELLSWMGATGVYVGGSNLLNLQAAVIVDATNPSLARAAVGKLAAAYRAAGGSSSPTSIPGTETAQTVKLSGFPLALTLAYGQGKFIAGLGTTSVTEALHPQSTLASSSAYGTAESALGQGIEPSALVEFHTMLGLMESLSLTEVPSFSGIAQALKPLNSLAAGGGKTLGGGVKRSRLTLSLASGG